MPSSAYLYISKLSALTADDLNRPAVPWVDFLHTRSDNAKDMMMLRDSYSFPWSSGEAVRRVNENGAVYLRNYLYVIASCAVAVLYKRPQALCGLMSVAIIYIAGKRFGESIKVKSEWIYNLLSLLAQVAVWLILSFSTATIAVAYAMLVGGAGDYYYDAIMITHTSVLHLFCILKVFVCGLFIIIAIICV